MRFGGIRLGSVCLLLACTAPGAQAATGPGAPVLRAADVPGLTAGRVSLAGASHDLEHFVGRTAARRVVIVGAAYHRGRGTARLDLAISAYLTGRLPLARAVLSGWRHANRGARGARVGDGGAITVQHIRRGPEVATVAVRAGTAVAVLQLRIAAAADAARRLALSYAGLEAARLRAAAALTAWDRAMAGVSASGAVSRQTVLQLFSLAHGRIPGVWLPSGDRRIPSVSTSWIVQRVLVDLWPTLTKGQRRAVARALWPARRAGHHRHATAASFVDGCLDTVGGLTLDISATDDARQLRAGEAKHMPFATANFGICAYVAPGSPKVYANTISWYWGVGSAPNDGRQDYGSFPNECFVRLYDGFRTLTVSHQHTILGHEMYHCVHGEWGMRHRFFPGVFGAFPGDNPPWVEDGIATWAGNEVGPSGYAPESEAPGLYYKVWLDHFQQLPLFQQSYEPYGFWGLVSQEASADALWARIIDIWNAGADSSTIFDIGTGPQRGLVLDHWGPGLFSRPGWPSGWQQQRPYAVDNPISVDAVVPVAGSATVETQPYAALKVQIDNTAQRLVDVFVDGHGSLTDGSSQQWQDPHEVWLCLGGNCTCPSGQHEVVPIPKHSDTGPLVYAGLAGDQFRTKLILVGHDLEEYCAKEQHPSGGGGGGGPPGGGSNGDPHLHTFDGLPYEFQALGEFVLARSTLGGFEVQSRQERVPGHLFFAKYISINSALAFRVGPARVTVSAGDPLVVRVRGRRVHPELRAVGLAGGGSIRASANTDACEGLVLRWGDGSLGCVWSVGGYGVATWLYPAARHRGHLVGLLGDYDGTTANDFRTRQGRSFALSDIWISVTRQQFDNRYHVFGESWRLRQRESLFDYGRRQSTATFTVRNFPQAFFPVTRLSRSARARAEAACRARGIVDPSVFEACVIDVGATGSDAFADSAATQEHASAVSTPWQMLAGLQHEVQGPVGLAATPDGRLHLAIMSEPTNNHSGPANYVETSLDGSDVQSGLTVDTPRTQLQYTPLLVTGQAGLRLLGFTDIWPDVQPPQTSPRGVMSWQNGVVTDWLPGATGEATSYAETADGTPYTVTQAVNNFLLWRGSGASAVAHQPPGMGPSCFDHSDQVASDGQQVWFAWLQINCANDAQNGIYVAPVNTVTGDIGPPAAVPRPPGATAADYDSTEPLAFVHRPGSSGAWLAYALRVRGTLHGFLLHTGDASATDIGQVASSRARVAATAAGRLWVGWFDNQTPHGDWLIHFRRYGPAGAVAEPGAWTVMPPTQPGGGQVPPAGVVVAARGERLDLVADAEGSLGGIDGAVWHARIG